MSFDFYRAAAATLYVLRFPLAVACLTFCVLLFRQNRNVGWLCLGVLFLEPFYRLAMRMIHGHHLLPFESRGGATLDGTETLNLRFEFPTLYVFAVLGFYLLYRQLVNKTGIRETTVI